MAMTRPGRMVRATVTVCAVAGLGPPGWLGTRVERVHHWWVVHYPVGLPFCVLPCPAAMLTDHNAHRWD